MCGIWTIIGNSYQKDFFNIFHRGPDISVYKKITLENNQNLQIGFHRLSIIDTTSDSHQPFIISKNNSTFI